MDKPRRSRAGVIVVVDEEPAIRTLIEVTLTRRGHAVVTAVSVPDGLAACAAAHPDVVIVDMILEPRSGLDLIRALRVRTPTARIIAISGGAGSEGSDLLLKAREAGVEVSLRQPVPINLIVELVEDLLL